VLAQKEEEKKKCSSVFEHVLEQEAKRKNEKRIK